jgi:hypothetical protein
MTNKKSQKGRGRDTADFSQFIDIPLHIVAQNDACCF